MVLAAAIAEASTAAQPSPAITWRVFVDDLHLEFRNTGRIRTLVRTVTRDLPVDGDAIAIFSSGPSSVSVMPTLDRALLDDDVKKLTGNGLRPEDTRGAPDDIEVRYRARLAQTRVRELA